MVKWEYLILTVPSGTLDQAKFNDLGRERWELVLLRSEPETSQLVFKRWKL